VEVNNIAREYGIEFKNRAFTKLGEPKQGYNADMYENTRKAVKDVLRTQLPDDLSKQLDMKMSDIYTTLDLTKKREHVTAALEQRITRRTLGQKVGGVVIDVADAAMFGALRGAFNRLSPSNVGNKTMNALEIQKELRKNIRTLEKYKELKSDKAFAVAMEDYVKNMQPGMSIRSTVTPLKVGKEMTEAEFNIVVNAIPDIQNARRSPDFNAILKKHGLDKADDAELERFLKDATDQFERPEDTY
jgi:DNA-binding transcriptional regulator GbsR (MarR family)